MGAKSNIEWTEATWNPVTGCTKVSAGCKNCYAETFAIRHLGEFRNDPARKFTDVRMHYDKLDIPLRWRKPRRIFVNSMSDLFHESIPDSFIHEVFSVMALAKHHTFQVLTKRAERMREYVMRVAVSQLHDPIHNAIFDAHDAMYGSGRWPLPNVWLGVSVENQQTADERIPLLIDSPAAMRFVSCEPLLEEIKYLYLNASMPNKIHWVIVGGESGNKARAMVPEWARIIRDECKCAGVPFFFKQWGHWLPYGQVAEGIDNPRDYDKSKWHQISSSYFINKVYRWMARPIGKSKSGRLLDDRTWDEMPA